MLDHSILQSVAEQMMGASENAHPPAKNAGRVGQPRPIEIGVGGKSFPVMQTGVNKFRTVRFEMGGKGYQAIEQNQEKPSRWGQLARAGLSRRAVSRDWIGEICGGGGGWEGDGIQSRVLSPAKVA